jgi:hypothetical protein
MADDDIADAIENPDDIDPEDLDDETREKLKKVLGEDEDDGEDAGGSDDSEEASAEADDEATDTDDSSEETSEQEADGDDEQEVDASDADDEASEASSDDGDDDSDADTDDSSDEEGDDEPQSVPGGFREPVERLALIGGVFDPESYAEDPDSVDGELQETYLGDDDLEGTESDTVNRTIFMFGALAVLLLVGGSWGLLSFSKQGDRIVHLFKGDLKEYERAKARQEKRRFEEKQLAQLPSFGTLSLRGFPKYSTLKVDGEVQYGKTPDSGEWRPVILKKDTQFQNLDIEKKHTVSASAPGHESAEWTLTEGMWNQVSGSDVDYQRTLNVNLLPDSQERQWEFKERMKKNPDNEFFGEVTLKTKPKGAKVIFDGKPLLDEEGEPLKTPVTFEKAYYEDEESGEIKERKVKVDMPPDEGHKIQLRMEDGDYPDYVTPLERQMWTCEWKDGEPPEEPPYAKGCNYKFEVDLDFDKLKSYIEERKKEKERIRKQNKKIDKKVKKVQKKAG